MNKKQYLSLLLATLISGLVGGAGFSWLFSGQQASAQNNSSTVISAQEFRLVDANGKLRAILSENPMLASGTPSLVFYDTNQKARLSVGTFRAAGSEPTINLMDENEMAIISLTRNQGTTSLMLKSISSKPLEGGSIERSATAALWLTQSAKDGANIRIFDKNLKLLWSARK